VVIVAMAMAGLSAVTPVLILVGALALSTESFSTMVLSYLAYPAAWPNQRIATLFGHTLGRALLACIVAYLSGLLVGFLAP
jgi:hypothetical protein